jgi:hypothetical protein
MEGLHFVAFGHQTYGAFLTVKDVSIALEESVGGLFVRVRAALRLSIREHLLCTCLTSELLIV